ncbi:MAG TPA: beta-ketoacyl-[acyl-carrier-protein] synthase family protein [Candidatus Angelobacter sp.]
MRNRVAITGMGVISSLGDSPGTLHSALGKGHVSSYRLDEPSLNGCRGQRSGKIAEFQPDSYLKGKNLRPLDRTGQLVVAAAKLALEDSGWTPERLRQHDAGLVVGTMFGSVHTIAKFDQHALEQGPACASPMDFANTVINAAAGQTAIWHNLRGINSTIASGSTSGLAALGYACDLICFGGQTAVLAGGVDEFCFESFCGFERAGMLSSDDTQAFPVPFHASRTGFVVGEAAGLLMLEEWEAATHRGARILAEVRGHGTAYDPSGDERRAGAAVIARAMRAALKDSELSTDEVDCISAAANGSIAADKDEAIAIESLFNGRGPKIPITAIKSMLGETLGASGSLQVIDLIETMRTGVLPGIRGLELEDSQLPKLNFCREQQEINARAGLINSIGFDGNVCSLLISAPSA